MKKILLCFVFLATILVLVAGTSNPHSVIRRNSEACDALQHNFVEFLDFVDEDCRNSVLPVVSLFSDQHDVAASEMASAAVCIPACQSLIDLEVECLGTEIVEKGVSFYCGSNGQGTPCYEALQINNGSRVSDVCAEDGCTASCQTELQQLVSDVGCCVSSIGYEDIKYSLYNNCGINEPGFCPHLFEIEGPNEACKAFEESFESFLNFVDEECRDAVLPVLHLFEDMNDVDALEMASAAVCIPACQSLIDLEAECLGTEFVEKAASFYCGSNGQGTPCYEALQINNGSRVADVCTEDGCPASSSCSVELQQLVSDVGCCVRSLGYAELKDSLFGDCDINKPGFCPHLFEIEGPNEACKAFEESFESFLNFVDEECRDAVLPVLHLFEDMNDVDALEMASAAVCIPACQSLIDLEAECLGTEFVEKAASFYCGSNGQGTPCYETLQINNGSRVADVCAEDGCPASCSAELQQLVSDVGCCVRSLGYVELKDSLFGDCDINKPGFCPHLFEIEGPNEACKAFEESFESFLNFVDEECRNAVLPVLHLFEDMNDVDALEMASAAVCIPACQSLIDLEAECLGTEFVEKAASFYCGSNGQGTPCYETLQINNGSRVADVCTEDGCPASSSCSVELQQLVSDVGCCVRSLGYAELKDSLFGDCDINKPGFCPHLFEIEGPNEACKAFEESFESFLNFVDEECRDAVLPVLHLFEDMNDVDALEMASAAVCIPACQSLIDLEAECLGTEFVEKAASFYCGSNDQGTPCYETLQINNGSRVAGVCAEDGCPASCSAELQQLVSDVGCCASSIGYGGLEDSLFGNCDINKPDFCPHLFNSDTSPTDVETTVPSANGVSKLLVIYDFLFCIFIFFVLNTNLYC